jgi:hypothetical protein
MIVLDQDSSAEKSLPLQQCASAWSLAFLTIGVHICSYLCWKRLEWAGLAAAMLSAELRKDPGLRTSNWETWPLSLEQQQYAALDAYASLLLYQVPLHVCLFHPTFFPLHSASHLVYP